jgi:hypothetical protein
VDVLPLLVQGLQQQKLQQQRTALADLKQRMRAIGRRDAFQDSQLVDLWSEVLDLKLYMATLFRLMVKKGLVTPEQLRQLVDEVDASDGTEDGVFRGDVIPTN